MGFLSVAFFFLLKGFGWVANAGNPHDRTFLYSLSYDNTVGVLNRP